MTLKAFAAVDWLVLFWLKWNLALLSTVSTSCIVHFSLFSSIWHVITSYFQF